MATKVTFTFDQGTIAAINRLAARKRMAKSAVVRAAVREFDLNADRYTAEELARMEAAVAKFEATAKKRSRAAVDHELAELRRARRGRGRLHPGD